MVTRNRKGQMERDLEQAELDAEAVRLRSVNRMGYSEIARRMGCSRSTAHGRVMRGLAAVPYEAVNELRRLELDSLDELEQKCREVLVAIHYRVDHGNMILGPDGRHLLDDAPVLHATAQILRIKDMRAKLTGAYAPTKSAVTVITEDAADAAIRQLEEELAANAERDRRSAVGEAVTA